MKQSPMPPRKQPMKRGTGLARSALKAAVRDAAPVRGRGLAPGRGDTGPSRRVRKMVMEREGGCCAACGRSIIGIPHSVQHRVARGMGGTSRPEANALPALILLCGSATTPGSCHLACERRDPHMHERGFWLWQHEDPVLIPVMLASEHGSGITVWLTADGQYSTEPPAEVAA